ncbi:MAG: curli assembly protein CsgF [Paludibacter sp.]|nr:curli assembly protein CsgF [Paludibacter sp.]
MKKHLITFIWVLFFMVGKSYAQDFVYQPKNPAFGGSPYNYSWLLSSAQAQNDTEDVSTTSDTYSNYYSDPLESFSESLNQQILSQLSKQIVSEQFGEDALNAGTYVLGDYQIVIGNLSSGMNITITDSGTGSTTTVSIPYF